MDSQTLFYSYCDKAADKLGVMEVRRFETVPLPWGSACDEESKVFSESGTKHAALYPSKQFPASFSEKIHYEVIHASFREKRCKEIRSWLKNHPEVTNSPPLPFLH